MEWLILGTIVVTDLILFLRWTTRISKMVNHPTEPSRIRFSRMTVPRFRSGIPAMPSLLTPHRKASEEFNWIKEGF